MWRGPNSTILVSVKVQWLFARFRVGATDNRFEKSQDGGGICKCTFSFVIRDACWSCLLVACQYAGKCF